MRGKFNGLKATAFSDCVLCCSVIFQLHRTHHFLNKGDLWSVNGSLTWFKVDCTLNHICQTSTYASELLTRHYNSLFGNTILSI